MTPLHVGSPCKNATTTKQDNHSNLRFLDPMEQARVQRLLEAFQGGEGKEMATQTEPGEEKAVARSMQETGSQTEKITQVQPYVCQDVLKSLALLHKKIDRQSPHWQTTPNSLEQSVSSDYNEKAFEVQNIHNHTQNSESIHIACTDPDPLTTIDPFSVLDQPPLQTNTPSDIQATLGGSQPITTCRDTPTINTMLEDTFKESSSMGNYAKNLTFSLFQRHELLGTNCAGVRGKKSLEKDNRMDVVKASIFKKYSIDNEKKVWAVCGKDIDTAIRHLKPAQ